MMDCFLCGNELSSDDEILGYDVCKDCRHETTKPYWEPDNSLSEPEPPTEIEEDSDA